MTLYAHNQQLLKTVGDWVVPGENIALVGDTGGQAQTGLYFEIRYKGRPANPQTWLVASRYIHKEYQPITVEPGSFDNMMSSD